MSNAKIHQDKATTLPTKITTIHSGNLITVTTETVSWPEGEKTYDIVSHPGAVAMLPIDDEGRMILISQWRRPIKQILLEIPAGTLEDGEDPDTCAIRELQEEIGFKPGVLTPLSTFYSAPGFCNEQIYLYLATDLIPSKLGGEDTDDIDIVHYTLDELDKLIAQGAICDAKTLLAITLYKNKHLQI